MSATLKASVAWNELFEKAAGDALRFGELLAAFVRLCDRSAQEEPRLVAKAHPVPDDPHVGATAGEVGMTHQHLVKMAGRWLRVRCPVVITEMSSAGGEEPDAIGWRTQGSILIECKASRSDLRADAAKPHRRPAGQLGPGERGCGMGNYRYVLAPPYVVKGLDDPLIPAGWGVLLAVSERSVRQLRPPELHQCDWDAERVLLVSCLRRLGLQSVEGTSVKVYKFQTRCRATVSLEQEEKRS